MSSISVSVWYSFMHIIEYSIEYLQLNRYLKDILQFFSFFGFLKYFLETFFERMFRVTATSAVDAIGYG